MNKTIVLGASGQLGQCLKELVNKNGIDTLVFPDRAEANILDQEALSILFERYQPAYVINCAAYTAVDKAEDEPAQAALVNKTGVENIARLCAQYNTTLVQISTDFVFKGDISSPLTEEDETHPIGVYGQTKLDGEKVISAFTDKYFIIRTSWLYSEFANNFAKTMLRLGADRSELKIIADQAGTPTYAIDLADALLNIISSGSTEYGIYHYSNEGIASWYDFAKAIFSLAGNPIKVLPIGTSEYPTKATRPPYSVMDKSKLKRTFGIEIPYWRDSLEVCINKIKQQQ